MWRLLIRSGTLLIAGVLMLVLAAPASYALQDDTPKPVTRPAQLLDKEEPLSGTYVHTSSIPDLIRIVSTQDLVGATYYWMVVPGYDNLLLVRTEGYDFLRDYARALDLRGGSEQHATKFYGKITELKGQAGSQEAIEEFANLGVELDEEWAMVILQGEEPTRYRPVVPVVGLLATSWLLALVGLVRILTGRRSSIKRKM
jgi:hypothetical protein